MGINFEEFKSCEKTLQHTYRTVQNGEKLNLQVDYKGITKKLFVEEVVSMLLANLKSRAEQMLNKSIKYAMVTVPSHFNSRQRQAVLNAGEIAGLNLRLVNDSTVIALKYCLGKKFTKTKNVLIFISGGGSTEVSIAAINREQCDIISSCGSNKLGGIDIDNRIVNFCIDYFKSEKIIDLTGVKQNLEKSKIQRRLMQRLLRETEKVKIMLSTTPVASVEIPYENEKDLKVSISRTR